MLTWYIFFLLFYFIFKLYNIVLVLPNIETYLPQVYPCSPSWTLALLPPHTLPLGHPSAPAPSIQHHATNLVWRLVSYMILHMFQCHSPKSPHPLPLPQSPKDWSIHQCLFCCLIHRVFITIFLNSIFIFLIEIFIQSSVSQPKAKSPKVTLEIVPTQIHFLDSSSLSNFSSFFQHMES